MLLFFRKEVLAFFYHACAAQPIGHTNYATLPFVSDIYRPCWGCTAGMDPAQLYFTANPASQFLDAHVMARARSLSAAQSARGIVPTAGMQRWEDTYEASFPAGTFIGEPAYIQAERAWLDLPAKPEFVAWRNFISSHPHYADVAFDGGTMPPQPDYYRSWGGQWGYISPLTPLDAADCAPLAHGPCTMGEVFAARWAATSRLSGGYGLQLSDFTDGQPYEATEHDFNPRIVAAFARTLAPGAVPAGRTSARAAWINSHAFARWVDFLDAGFAHFYAALAKDVGQATGHPPLIIGQCSISPASKRIGGVDARILAKVLSPDNFMCIWDDQVIQRGRSGPLANPPAGELAGYVLAAAREPDVRNGADLEADDAAYWAAIAQFYPGVPAATRHEIGLKLLKRLWVWSAWAHIATRTGQVRRAIAFASRDYWDVGSLAAIGPAASLIHRIVPSHPFGAALYYSAAVERATEEAGAATAAPGAAPTTYLMPPVLQALLDGGAPIGYYVSDAALLALKQAANLPSAWVVPGAATLLPPSERAALSAIAPVVGSAADLAALPRQPLQLPPGLAGFGFISEAGRLIVVASNPRSAAGAASISGTITASRHAAAAYSITELQSGTRRVAHQAGGFVRWPVTVAPWDTLIFEVAPVAARPK